MADFTADEMRKLSNLMESAAQGQSIRQAATGNEQYLLDENHVPLYQIINLMKAGFEKSTSNQYSAMTATVWSEGYRAHFESSEKTHSIDVQVSWNKDGTEQKPLIDVEVSGYTEDSVKYRVEATSEVFSSLLTDEMKNGIQELSLHEDNEMTKEIANCNYCKRMKAEGHDFYPPHKASSRCESGGRNHCSCNTCF